MVQCVVCEIPLTLATFSLLAVVMVVAASSSANIVLELGVDVNVPRDYDMLEVEGAEDGMEKKGVANRYWKVDGK